MLPIDRTAKSALDKNLVNGIISDAPAIKSSNDTVYNTIDELYGFAQNMVTSAALEKLNAIYTKNASATLLGSEVGIIEATSGASGITLTLPSATAKGLRYTIKKVDSASGTVTINTISSQAIDGATSRMLTNQYSTLTIVSNGTNWDVVKENIIDLPMSNISRQAIINGNFDVWQRGNSLSSNADILDTYLADRWMISSSKDGGTHATITHSQASLTSGELPNSYYAYQIHSDGFGATLGANSYAYIYQRIENGVRYLAGAGRKVTVSFYAKSNQAGKRIGIALQQEYGSGGTPSPSEIITGTIFTLTNTLTKYSFTFNTNTLVGKTFGTNKDDHLWLQVFHMWGTSIAARFNTVTAEAYGGMGDIFITQVQVNGVDQALTFQPKSVDAETKDSLRYAWIPQKSSVFVRATSYNANTITFDVPLPVQLRANPSIRGVSNTDIVVNTIAIAAQTGFTFASTLTSNGARIIATKTAHGLTDGYLEIKTTSGLDAEL